jgi:hypothetical protein
VVMTPSSALDTGSMKLISVECDSVGEKQLLKPPLLVEGTAKMPRTSSFVVSSARTGTLRPAVELLLNRLDAPVAASIPPRKQ